MSATKWKTKGFVRPYVRRGWKIPHGGLCNRAEEAGEKSGFDAPDRWLREVEPEEEGRLDSSLTDSCLAR